MGTIREGILGGFSGKVGPVVGAKWKSIRYIRSLAASTHNPNTEKQQWQRLKFKVVIDFLKPVVPFIQTGYRNYEEGKSAYNAAASFLLRHAVMQHGGQPVLDFNRVRVSQGSLTAAEQATVRVEEGKALFAWADNSGSGDATASDRVLLLAYNKNRKQAVYHLAAATRADASAELALPADWKGDALALYLSFSTADGKHLANSCCVKEDTSCAEVG